MQISPPFGYQEVVPFLKTQKVRLLAPGEVPEFAQHGNAIPISLSEFQPVARDYPIVFTAADGTQSFAPVAVLGLPSRENLFYDNGNWVSGMPCQFVCSGGACSGECSPGDGRCKTNTIPQMQSSLTSIFALEIDPRDAALRETEEAIGLVINQAEAVELSPQNAYIRRLQHQMAERANLVSRSRGREPYRRVRLYPDPAKSPWR